MTSFPRNPDGESRQADPFPSVAGPGTGGVRGGRSGRPDPALSPSSTGTGSRGPAVAVPALNLLHPRLPARRARMAAALTIALLVVALLDLSLVLVWSGLWVANGRLATTLEHLLRRESVLRVATASHAEAARERTEIRARLELLRSLPAGYPDSEGLMQRLGAALPPGTTLTDVNLTPERRVVVTGLAPSYGAVEDYARALQSVGDFSYVRIASSGVAMAGTGASETGSGGVDFQMEAWLKGEGTR